MITNIHSFVKYQVSTDSMAAMNKVQGLQIWQTELYKEHSPSPSKNSQYYGRWQHIEIVIIKCAKILQCYTKCCRQTN